MSICDFAIIVRFNFNLGKCFAQSKFLHYFSVGEKEFYACQNDCKLAIV